MMNGSAWDVKHWPVVLRICQLSSVRPAPACMYTDSISAPPGTMPLWWSASTRPCTARCLLSPAPLCGVARPCRIAAATPRASLAARRLLEGDPLAMLRTGRAQARRTPASLASASRPLLPPRRPWPGATPEPKENPLGLLGRPAWAPVKAWSVLPAASWSPAATRPAPLSLDAFQPTTAVCSVNGPEDSAAHVGSTAIRRTTRLCTGPQLVRHGNCGDETKRAVPGDTD